MLPAGLKERAMMKAREMGISFGEVIRMSLECLLKQGGPRERPDPFLEDTHYFRADHDDLAAHHDDFLYGGSR